MQRATSLSLGLGTLAAFGLGAASTAYLLKQINAIGSFPPERLRRLRESSSNALFDAFPRLADRLPWRPIGAYPTPVVDFPLERQAAGVRLYVKRDDLASDIYGGNKVRKLEFFLAEAELNRRRTLITLGGIGSNHALATALHGQALGFEVDLILYDQPITRFVRANLGGFLQAGARLHYGRSIPRSFLLARRIFRRRAREGRHPYFVMVGGTSRLGCLGHVAAGVELGRQVGAGILPEPDTLFVPLGTSGTAAGLLVGLRLAGLQTRVAAVRVADAFVANAFVLRRVAQDAADYLHELDPAVPAVRIGNDDFEVIPRYLGAGYGHTTAACEAAVLEAAPVVALETTYTGKTLAACLDYCSAQARDEVVLFWNTYNSAPVAAPASLETLPVRLRRVVNS